MIQFIRFLVISLLACVVASADPLLEPAARTAVTATDPYAARVPVTARTDEARDAAFQAGLRQVYMELTGQVNMDKYAPLKQSIPHATEWVDQYQYQQTGDSTYMLIRYNKARVNGALTEAGLAVYTGAPSAPLDGTGLKDVILSVSDVNELESYMRIDAYLGTVPGVGDVETAELNMPTVTFRVTLVESVSDFEQALASGDFLQQSGDTDDSTDPITLHYRYNGL